MESLYDLSTKIEKRAGVSRHIVENTIKSFFKELRNQMTSDEVPSILIHGLGTFAPKETKVKRAILMTIAQLRNNKDKEKKEKLQKELRNLWKLRKRLQQLNY